MFETLMQYSISVVLALKIALCAFSDYEYLQRHGLILIHYIMCEKQLQRMIHVHDFPRNNFFFHLALPGRRIITITF